MKTARIPDQQTTRSADGKETKIRYGTPLHRLNSVVEEQPADMEFAEFLVGDLRDVCSIVGQKEKGTEELLTLVKNKPGGSIVSASIATVKSLIASAIRAGK